jgi:hypothetical protein
MSYTLGKLLFETYSALGQITTFAASGGSATTAVNTKTGYTQSNLTGAILIRETTDAAAPVNEFQEVSSFTQSSGTFTVSTAFSAAIGAGDIFGYASPLYPLRQMIESINEGLRYLGDLYLVDTTTLDTATTQTEYTASVTWKRRPPVRIDLQTKLNDANDNRWMRLSDWEYVPAAPGSTGLIVFKQQLPISRDLRIWYEDVHPRVTDFDDVIAEVINPELAVAVCAEKASKWQVNRTQGSDPGINRSYEDAKNNMEMASVRYPLWKPDRVAKIFNPYSRYGDDSGDPTKMRL